MIEALNLNGRATTPFIPQDEASECALACIAMVAGYYGLTTDIFTLRRKHATSLRGANIKQMMLICEQIGLTARPVRGEIEDLSHLALPAILHWNLSHFVVLTKVSRGLRGERFHISDPAKGEMVLGREAVSDAFTGVAVEILKAESFTAANSKQALSISQLWSSTSGIGATLRNTLLVSLVIQFVALATPFYTQIAIDSVLPARDTDLLGVLAIGFVMLAVVGYAASIIRGIIISSANSALSYQIVVNLFRHLTRLPLSWYEKRHVGDIVSRFSSTRPISQLISDGMIAAFVDGGMALIALALMLVYSPLLTTLAVVALMLYAIVRFLFLRTVKLRNIDVVTSSANENSVFMETVRGAAAIKAFAQEGNRLRIWQRSKAKAVNAEIKLARITNVFDATASFIPALERVIFLYIAVKLIFSAKMTIGMAFAFQAYKQQFIDASIRVVEQAINYRVIQVHLGRIADIALSSPELDLVEAEQDEAIDLKGGMTVSDIRFRYGTYEQEILSGVSLHVKPGEMVALVGPSGGGKTTLLKIMMGLMDPTAGRIAINGKPLSSISKSVWRRSIGYVAQEDKLFSGSIAENIGFFDPLLDMNQVREAAAQASVQREIEAFPMGYETKVGDMGSALSGGQKQRILLARALYGKPTVLFLDEGTAHLDATLEKTLIESLRNLGIAVVMVAHRSLSIAAADTLYHIEHGMIRRAIKNSPPAEKDGVEQSGPIEGWNRAHAIQGAQGAPMPSNVDDRAGEEGGQTLGTVVSFPPETAR